MTIRVQRDTLAKMLRSHGEDDLAERAESLSDDELTRIGTLGAYYAWSEDALALDGRGSMGGRQSAVARDDRCGRGHRARLTPLPHRRRARVGMVRGAGGERAHPGS